MLSGTAEWLESLPKEERDQIINNISKAQVMNEAIHDNHQAYVAAAEKHREQNGIAADEAEKAQEEKEGSLTLELRKELRSGLQRMSMRRDMSCL